MIYLLEKREGIKRVYFDQGRIAVELTCGCVLQAEIVLLYDRAFLEVLKEPKPCGADCQVHLLEEKEKWK